MMISRTRFNSIVLMLAAATVLTVAHPAHAIVFTFDDVTVYDYYADPDCTAETSSEQAFDGSNSGKLALNDTDSYARVAINYNAGTLDEFVGTFQTYITSDSPSTLAPYMMLGLDSDGNGVFEYGPDALVIAFISGGGSYATGTWFETGLDQTTNVHVVGNRNGLASSDFSASGTQDTVAALSAISYDGSTLWGDLDVVQVRVGAGLWPSGEILPYTAYVDNIEVPSTSIPDASTLLLLGSAGLIGLAGSRRKRTR